MSNKQYNFYLSHLDNIAPTTPNKDVIGEFKTIDFPYFNNNDELELTIHELFFERDAGTDTLMCVFQLGIDESDLYEYGISGFSPNFVSIRSLKNDSDPSQRTYDSIKYRFKLSKPSLTFRVRVLNTTNVAKILDFSGEPKYGVSCSIRKA